MPKTTAELLAEIQAMKGLSSASTTGAYDPMGGFAKAQLLKALSAGAQPQGNSLLPQRPQQAQPQFVQDVNNKFFYPIRDALKSGADAITPDWLKPPASPDGASTMIQQHPRDSLKTLGGYDPTLLEHIKQSLAGYNATRTDGGFDTLQHLAHDPAQDAELIPELAVGAEQQ